MLMDEFWEASFEYSLPVTAARMTQTTATAINTARNRFLKLSIFSPSEMTKGRPPAIMPTACFEAVHSLGISHGNAVILQC